MCKFEYSRGIIDFVFSFFHRIKDTNIVAYVLFASEPRYWVGMREIRMFETKFRNRRFRFLNKIIYVIMFNASRGNLLTYCETFDTFFMGKFYNSLSKVKLENLKFVNRFKPVERASQL